MCYVRGDACDYRQHRDVEYRGIFSEELVALAGIDCTALLQSGKFPRFKISCHTEARRFCAVHVITQRSTEKVANLESALISAKVNIFVLEYVGT